jgi:hypothetical protein
MESKPPISDGKKNIQTAGEPEALGTILATIGDTTWRMFVPSVGFTLLGVWLDSVLATKPWLMFVGIVIGFAFAILLVRRQITAIRRLDDV